jgi:hypothetical protein
MVGAGHFRATAVEWDSVTARTLVLSSNPSVILELDSAGIPLTVTPLDPRRHPQAEALTLTGSRLVIGDEAAGRRRGTLTAYSCAP